MMLSQNFSLAEFTASDTALRFGIHNELPEELLDAARRTALMLEAVRSHLVYLRRADVPIHITSGYRSLQLNHRIGSSPSSDHVKAMAADIKAPAFGTPLQICQAIEPVREQLGIGQLIHEYGAWVHLSTRKPMNHVNQVLTIDEDGVRPGLA
jgi:zinc D-Ala-D-Ala carboxypeptidase